MTVTACEGPWGLTDPGSAGAPEKEGAALAPGSMPIDRAAILSAVRTPNARRTTRTPASAIPSFIVVDGERGTAPANVAGAPLEGAGASSGNP